MDDTKKINFSFIFNMGLCTNENTKYVSRRKIEYFHIFLRNDLFSDSRR